MSIPVVNVIQFELWAQVLSHSIDQERSVESVSSQPEFNIEWCIAHTKSMCCCNINIKWL